MPVYSAANPCLTLIGTCMSKAIFGSTGVIATILVCVCVVKVSFGTYEKSRH